jgi:hypothetical protein
MIIAGLAGFADAVLFDKTGSSIPITIMVFALVGSMIGVAYFHFESTGWPAAAFSLTGFLLILVNFPMYKTTIREYLFAIVMLLAGVPFLLFRGVGRWVSILWFVASFLSFPVLMFFRSGLFHNSIIFNAVLLVSGFVLIWQSSHIINGIS